MSTSVAVVVSVAIFALVVLVALFRMGYVRAAGSFGLGSFELEAKSSNSLRSNAHSAKK